MSILILFDLKIPSDHVVVCVSLAYKRELLMESIEIIVQWNKRDNVIFFVDKLNSNICSIFK